jgi:hypothetical protein
MRKRGKIKSVNTFSPLDSDNFPYRAHLLSTNIMYVLRGASISEHSEGKWMLNGGSTGWPRWNSMVVQQGVVLEKAAEALRLKEVRDKAARKARTKESRKRMAAGISDDSEEDE